MTPGSPGGVFFFFNGHDFFHAALMAATGKLRIEPFIHDGKSLLRIEDASAQREHIGIVMLAAHLRFIFCAYVCGPDAIDLLAVIAMPMPLPQTRMPRSARCSLTSCATARA